jgi:hypothetical protein
VSADNAFPYRLCSGQQESGSACVASRGNDGQVTFRDWHPVAAEEYGYVVADPLDPDIVYGGKLTRYDRRTGQAQNILPRTFRSPDFRMLRTQPVIFSPVDSKTLFFATNTLWKTLDGGNNWEQISPDLTRKTFEVPASVGKYRSQPTAQSTQRGVIYTVAPSPLDIKRIWIGTDDGLIYLTTDGGAHWTDVTPKQIKPWEKISIIDAGHFDAGTAYAAVNTLRLDDLRPHIYRTHDSGATWTEVTNGIPANENTNAVREDPERKGLLFAGTERTVHVSFDDGEHWQSLRIDLPASSVRDLIIKGDDVCIGTHGRGFWILDNITALRQVEPKSLSTALFRPQTALRVRWNLNTDTPLPPDEPGGENPPDGTFIDYHLDAKVTGPVTLEVRDEIGQVVRSYSSADPLPTPDPVLPVPAYWLRPVKGLRATPGTHRFVWDLHMQPIPGLRPNYPIAAVYRNTAPEPTGPWVMPGTYSVVLTANGKTYKQPLTVAMDPRVKTSSRDLATQFRLSRQVYDRWREFSAVQEQGRSIRTQLTLLKTKAQSQALKDHIEMLSQKVTSVLGADNAPPGAPTTTTTPTVQSTLVRLRTLFTVMQGVDLAPTPQVSASVADVSREAAGVAASWQSIKTTDIPALNRDLSAAGLDVLRVE